MAWLYSPLVHTGTFDSALTQHGLLFWQTLVTVRLGLRLPVLPAAAPMWRTVCPVFGCPATQDDFGHHRAAHSVAVGGVRQQFHDNLRRWLCRQLRAAQFSCCDEEHRIPPVADDGRRGDIYLQAETSALGSATVIDITRTHTHTASGEHKPKPLGERASAKYSKYSQGYKAQAIGFFPFVVDTLGRLHDDAVRCLWHVGRRQTARSFYYRGLDASARDLVAYQRESARRLRCFFLECSMRAAVDGALQRLPARLLAHLPRDGAHALGVRGGHGACDVYDAYNLRRSS